jgi:hypothetical protein
VADLDTKNGFLVFKDTTDFLLASSLVANANPDMLSKWEKSHNFASLHKLYKQVVSEQTNYLKTFQTAFKEKPAFMPLCETLRKHEDKFFVSEYSGIDMKVTIDAYSYFVNINNLVQIGNQIYQFNYNDVRIISLDKLQNQNVLASLANKTNEVVVTPVKRVIQSLGNGGEGVYINTRGSGGRTESRSCDSRIWEQLAGNNREDAVLAYLEQVSHNVTLVNNRKIVYSNIKLRSLSLYLWWWSDYDTYNLKSNGSVGIKYVDVLGIERQIRSTYSTSPYQEPTSTFIHTISLVVLPINNNVEWLPGVGWHIAQGNYREQYGNCACRLIQ